LENKDFIDSKFRYAILVAKRAKQLVKGSKPKVDIKSENPLTLAIEEINQGKINFQLLEDNETNGLEPEDLFPDEEGEPTPEEEIDDSEEID
jgi:DNA-directed RNA polymerase subunit omega